MITSQRSHAATHSLTDPEKLQRQVRCWRLREAVRKRGEHCSAAGGGIEALSLHLHRIAPAAAMLTY